MVEVPPPTLRSLQEVRPEYERKVPRSLLLLAALFVELAAALDDHASATVDGHGVTFTASAVLLVEVPLRRR